MIALGAAGVTGVLVPTWSAHAEPMDLHAKSGEPVYFRGWQYRTDVVQDNVDRYNKELERQGRLRDRDRRLPVDHGKEPDRQGGARRALRQPVEAVRYFEGGWIMPASDLPNGDRRSPTACTRTSARPGPTRASCSGLSYFVVDARRRCTVNLDKYSEAGFTDADFPKNWPEFYDMLYKLRDKGEKQPLLPHWFNEWFGISLGLRLRGDEPRRPGGRPRDPQAAC